MATAMVAGSPPKNRRGPLKPVDDAEVAELRALAEKLQGRPLPGVRVTEAQFLHRYGHPDLNAEWVKGEVIVPPPANLDRVDLNFWLVCVVRAFAEHHDLGRVFGIEAQMRLREIPSRRNPDLFFISTANAARLKATHLEGPADLAMEIVSPDSAARDWRDKYHEYEKSGVREYWLIDPKQQRCEAYSLGRNKKYGLLREEDGRIQSKVLKGLYLRPAWLWQSPRPKLAGVLKELGVR